MNRDKRQKDVEREIQSYLDLEAEEACERGLSHQEARYGAHVSLAMEQ